MADLGAHRAHHILPCAAAPQQISRDSAHTSNCSRRQRYCAPRDKSMAFTVWKMM
jgi:hypothetical protein